MKLMTKALEEKFKEYSLGSQENKFGDTTVLCKFFNPSGAGTWLITEAGKEDDDWILFGYRHLGSNENAEFGYVSLNELQNFKDDFFHLGIERDLSYDTRKISLREACKKEFNYIPEILEERASVEVLQLKIGEKYHLKRFASLEDLNYDIKSIEASDYKNIYTTTKSYVGWDNEHGSTPSILEDLFMEYNSDFKPEGYRGHSLSVSDVVILSYQGERRAYYCDRFGFVKLSEEFVKKWNELNYNLEKEETSKESENDIDENFADLDV